jgi:hypothetical protein
VDRNLPVRYLGIGAVDMALAETLLSYLARPVRSKYSTPEDRRVII